MLLGPAQSAQGLAYRGEGRGFICSSPPAGGDTRADEEDIFESILNPAAGTAEGYQRVTSVVS
jgi:hypothetical protein